MKNMKERKSSKEQILKRSLMRLSTLLVLWLHLKSLSIFLAILSELWLLKLLIVNYRILFRWYRNLFQRRDRLPWKPGPVHLSSQMRIVPYILRMKWKGNPLHYHKQLGWGYLISVHGQSAQDNRYVSLYYSIYT